MNAPQNLEHLDINILVPYARNSRTHSPEQVRQIAASIREFGFTNPVLIDADNGIIAGHGRVMGAQQLGLSQVPCLRLAHLSEAQKRAYVIADNQLALNSGWDEDMLRAELLDLRGDDFDLDLLGFEDEFLDNLLEEEQPENTNDADHVPEAPANPVTRMGDVWVLGKHRIMCGDSTHADDVSLLLGGGHAASYGY
jgi:ParB-like chromosome segregation protein Spo0J